jgi:hypothetical protein
LPSGSSLRDRIQDELSVGAPDLQCLLEVPKQALGLGRILPPLGHVPEDGDLPGQTPLALGEVPVGLGEVFAFLLHVRHGPDHAPDRGRWPRIPMSPLSAPSAARGGGTGQAASAAPGSGEPCWRCHGRGQELTTGSHDDRTG